jgi:murein DD-endopeptidase MepM/ murein hydrolase activator NlpD
LATSRFSTATQRSVPPSLSPTIHRIRSRRRTTRRTSLAALGVIASVLLGVTTTSAVAAPGPPSDEEVSAAEAEHAAAAVEVQRIEQLVAAAEEDLARVTVEAEAAADASLVAQAELAAAEQRAAEARAQMEAATAAVLATRADVAELGRESYMRGDAYTGAVLLSAEDPADLLERAATLELLGDARAAQLDQLEVVEFQQAAADRAARESVAERNGAAGAAAEAEAAARRQLEESQKAYDAVGAEKAWYEEQLRGAEIEVLRLQGARDAVLAWEQEQQVQDSAAAARASAEVDANALAAAQARRGAGGAVAPTTGRVTSCYGARWGTTHFGVDIANAIGTPIYAPEGGRVLQAGPASGFGLALYLQHADGSITLYGHINQAFVRAGQQVAAGQRIAEIGNKGQSTGPHLHFEVHTGGLYENRVDPTSWLTARGLSLGGCG